MNETEQRRSLGRLLESDALASAPVCKKLLRFLCEARWRDPDDQPSQYDLANHLYESLEATDLARARGIAGQLRKRLALYYADEGQDDEIRVELPKGGYGIRFRRADPEPPATPGDLHDEASPPTVLLGRLLRRFRLREGIVLLSLLLLLTAITLVFGLLLGDRGSLGMQPPASAPSEDPASPPSGPCRVETEGATLYVLDCSGNRIASYTADFPLKPYRPSRHRHLTDIEDIDGDGIDDLVVGTAPDPEPGGGELHILRGGTNEWIAHVPLRHELRGASILHAREFKPIMVNFLHVNEGEPSSILAGVTSSNGSLGYFLHLDLEGEELGILWTWGHPREDLEETDLDGDGKIECLVAVRHDGADHPWTALVVLDPTEPIQGYVPHPPGNPYFPPDAEADGYLEYLLFPHTELTEPGAKNYIHRIRALEGQDLIQVMVAEGAGMPRGAQIWYWLDRDLDLRRIQFPDPYILQCERFGCSPLEEQRRDLRSRIWSAP